jgi:hypothetical protein
MQAAKEGTVTRAKLESKARELARDVSCRRADLYSTRQFQEDASGRLIGVLDADPKSPEVAQLAAQLAEGRVLDRYRREQASLMPALSTSHPMSSSAAQRARKALGDARFDMAHARLRMDRTGGDRREWQHWQSRHLDAAQRASLAAAELSAIETAGTSDGWTAMSDDDKRALRDRIADDGTFDTPATPRPYEDILEETQDILDGHTPVREPVDDIGFTPFGPTEPRRRTNSAAPDSEDTASDTDTDTDTDTPKPPRRKPRAGTRQDRLARQSKRRRGRKTDARRMMRDMRRTQGYFSRLDRRLDPVTDAVDPQIKEAGGFLDMTMLSLLMDAVSRGRR